MKSCEMKINTYKKRNFGC